MKKVIARQLKIAGTAICIAIVVLAACDVVASIAATGEAKTGISVCVHHRSTPALILLTPGDAE